MTSIILTGAVVLRVTWGILVPVVPVSDGKAYDILAHNLIDYGIYGWSVEKLSGYWPPGTPAIYAALYAIFGYNFASIVALNIALSTAIVGLTIWLGRIFFNEITALIAGVLMAIWPSEITFVTILASELPFTFLVLLGGAAWFCAHWSKYARAIVTGIVFGAATYFRSVALLLPIVLWLTAIPNWKKLRSQVPMVIVAMIMCCAVIAPWSIRNSKVFGHVVTLTTSDGVNLWLGNNPNATGLFMDLPPATKGLSEYEQNRVLGEQARQYIMAEPIAFTLRILKKAVLLHLGETIAVVWNLEGIENRFGEKAVFPLKLMSQGFWTCVLLFALAGIAVLVRRRGIMQTLGEPAVLIWVYFTAIYSIYFAIDRYHFPSHPFIAMLAAVAILASIGPTKRGDAERSKP